MKKKNQNPGKLNGNQVHGHGLGMKWKYRKYIHRILDKIYDIIDEVWIDKGIQSDYIAIVSEIFPGLSLIMNGKDWSSENITHAYEEFNNGNYYKYSPVNGLSWPCVTRTVLAHDNDTEADFIPGNMFPIGTKGVNIYYDMFKSIRTPDDKMYEYRPLLDADNYGGSRKYLNYLNKKLAAKYPDRNLWAVAFDFEILNIFDLDKLPEEKRY